MVLPVRCASVPGALWSCLRHIRTTSALRSAGVRASSADEGKIDKICRLPHNCSNKNQRRRGKMKIRIIALLVAALIVIPGTSHAFGLFRWAFDAVANQLGLDRGPIPKVLPQNPPPDVTTGKLHMVPPHPDGKKIYIQAEGF